MAKTGKELIDEISEGVKKLSEAGLATEKTFREISKKSGVDIKSIFGTLNRESDSFFDRLEKRTNHYRDMVVSLAKGESNLQKALFLKGSGKKQPFYFYDTEGQEKLKKYDLPTLEKEYMQSLGKARGQLGMKVSDRFFETAQENMIQNLFRNFGFRSTGRFLTDELQKYSKEIDSIKSNRLSTQKGLDEALSKYSDETRKRTDLSSEEKEGIIKEAEARVKYFKETQDNAIKEYSLFAKESIAQEGIDSLFTDIGEKVSDYLESIYRQAKKTIEDISVYSLSSSYIVDSRARQQALQYGLSDTQNYAFTQTKQLLGISSDEDLFWLNSNQRSKFAELMEKESAVYDTMLSDGTLEGFQELKIDFAVLKQEYMASVVKFISENKDTIISFMNLGLNALQGILSVVSGIFNIINTLNPLSDKFWFSRISGGSNTTYNITMNNTATATSKEQTESLTSGLSERVATQLKTYFES